MKTFCESLREHAKNTDFEKKNMLLLTKEELKSHHDAKLFIFVEQDSQKKFANDKNY